MPLHSCSLYATFSQVETFPYAIAYYLTEAGGKPFKEWLDGLKDIMARQKIRIRLDRVRLGSLGRNRSVGEGVYELKDRSRSGVPRVLRSGEKKRGPASAGRRQVIPEKGHHPGPNILGGPQKEKEQWLKRQQPIRKTSSRL